MFYSFIPPSWSEEGCKLKKTSSLMAVNYLILSCCDICHYFPLQITVPFACNDSQLVMGIEQPGTWYDWPYKECYVSQNKRETPPYWGTKYCHDRTPPSTTYLPKQKFGKHWTARYHNQIILGTRVIYGTILAGRHPVRNYYFFWVLNMINICVKKNPKEKQKLGHTTSKYILCNDRKEVDETQF